MSGTIDKGNNTIAFTNPGTKSLSASPVALIATGHSSASVVLTSTTPGVCTVAGASATLVSAGTCTIIAGLVGIANWNAAPQNPQSFTVTR